MAISTPENRAAAEFQRKVNALPERAQLLVGVLDSLLNPRLPDKLRDNYQWLAGQLEQSIQKQKPETLGAVRELMDWRAAEAPDVHWSNERLRR